MIGAEHIASLSDEEVSPATVYIPSERVVRREQNVTLELRRLVDGNVALLAYTSLELLVEGCGNRQPWVAVRSDALEDLRCRSGADVVLWDAAIPVEERRSGIEEGG